MLKFKDFKCDGKRNFWTGNFDMSADEVTLNEINNWLRAKAVVVINVESVQTSSRPSAFAGRLIRVWFTE